MKIDAMHEWTPEEKAAKAKEWTQTLFTLRLQKATGQLENPMKIREMKKDLARLKTAANRPSGAPVKTAPNAPKAPKVSKAPKPVAKKAAPVAVKTPKAKVAHKAKAAPKAPKAAASKATTPKASKGKNSK